MAQFQMAQLVYQANTSIQHFENLAKYYQDRVQIPRVDIKGPGWNSSSTDVYSNGAYGKKTQKYEGATKGRWPQGPGKWENLAEDRTYEGFWLDGQPHGQGRYMERSRVIYEGEFEHGAPWGQGTYRWDNGTYYMGNVRDGLDGWGMIVSGETKFMDNWRKGRRSGEGVFIYGKTQICYLNNLPRTVVY
jgi:hypothetical protein